METSSILLAIREENPSATLLTKGVSETSFSLLLSWQAVEEVIELPENTAIWNVMGLTWRPCNDLPEIRMYVIFLQEWR